jgi:hypothetical protein
MKKHWILLTAVALIIVGIILNAIFGHLFCTGAYCRNYFAFGDYAMGFFAAGKFSIGIFSAGTFSIGIFSIGIFSIGIFSLGIFNIALYAIGFFVIARHKRLPKLFYENSEHNSLNIKKPLMVLILVGAASVMQAQDSTKFRIAGGFGGPMVNVASITSKPALSIGGGGAMVFSNGLFVGGFGMGTSDLVTVKSTIADYKLQSEYGGLWLGYSKRVHKRYRMSASLKSGFGAVKLVNSGQKQLFYDDIFVLTPEISVSRRLNSYSAFELGVFYNAFTGVNFQNYRNEDFSSVGISLMLKFGGGKF